MNTKNKDKVRTINTLKTYYRLYLTDWKYWIIAIGGLPILILILVGDFLADCLVFLLFMLRISGWCIHRYELQSSELTKHVRNYGVTELINRQQYKCSRCGKRKYEPF